MKDEWRCTPNPPSGREELVAPAMGCTEERHLQLSSL